MIRIKIYETNPRVMDDIKKMAILRKDEVQVSLTSGLVLGVVSRDGKRFYPKEVARAAHHSS